MFENKSNYKSEAELQSRCFKQLWNEFPELRFRYFLIYNNPPNAIVGGMLKAMGLLAGTADNIFLALDGKVDFLEFKKGKNGKQSEDQQKFQARVESFGHRYHLIRSEEDFWKALGLTTDK